MEYKLTVLVKGYGREGIGEASSTFLTNSAPYGGHCEADPSIGKYILVCPIIQLFHYAFPFWTKTKI